jgi:hypothetical protein
MATDLLGSMRVEIIGDNSKLDKSITESEKKTKKFGDSTAKLGASLGKLFAGIGFAIVAKKIFDISKRAAELAATGEEIRSKFNAVFKEGAAEVQAWAETYSKSVGRSDTQTLSFLATLQDTFVPMGIARDTAAEFSKTMVELAGDVGSFNDVSTGDVIRDFQSALVGNHETLRKYGVVINETTLLQEAINSGLVTSKNELTEEIKIRARMNILIAGTTDAQGDLSRTQDSATNVEAALNSQIEKTLELYGDAVNKGLTPWRKAITGTITDLNNLITTQILQGKITRGEATTVEELINAKQKLSEVEKELARRKVTLAIRQENLNNITDAEISRQRTSREALERRISAEQENIRQTEIAIGSIAKGVGALEEKIIAERDAQQAVLDLALGIDEQTKSIEENTEAQLKAAEELADLRAQETKDFLERNEAKQEANAEALEKFIEDTEAEAEATEESERRKQEAQAATLEAALAIASLLEGVLSLRVENARAALDEFESINGEEIASLEAKAASEEGLTANEKLRLDALNEQKRKLANEQYDRELEAFKAGKVFKISETIQTGANAAINAFNALAGIPIVGPVLGGIAAAAAGILTGVQVGLIAKQAPPPKPKFAQGGIIAGNNFVGDQVPILANSGEAVINRADQQSLMDFIKGGSRGTSSGGGTTIVNAVVDKKVLFSIMLNGSKTGQLTLNERSIVR